MKWQVVWSQDALDDIDEYISYIGRENEATALRMIDRMEKAAFLLSEVAIGRPGRVADTFEKSVTGTPFIISYALREKHPVAGHSSRGSCRPQLAKRKMARLTATHPIRKFVKLL